MKLVATCSSVGEADTISRALNAAGINAHVLETATSNIGVPGIPVSGNVMVSDSDAIEAQAIIQRDFPNQRNADIKLCSACLEQKEPIKKIGALFFFWVAIQAAFFFRSFCPRCRRFF